MSRRRKPRHHSHARVGDERQELGDFGVLVHGGRTRARALLWNLASGLTFLLGALLAFTVSFRFDVEISGASARYAHHAQLAGGIVLLIIGMLLLFRPGWLTFG